MLADGPLKRPLVWRVAPTKREGMEEQERIDRTNVVKGLLGKNRSLSPEDIQVLRENIIVYPYLASNSDPIRWRMEIELLDSIQKLNRTSTQLMVVGIAVAVVGVLLTIVGLLK